MISNICRRFLTAIGTKRLVCSSVKGSEHVRGVWLQAQYFRITLSIVVSTENRDVCSSNTYEGTCQKSDVPENAATIPEYGLINTNGICHLHSCPSRYIPESVRLRKWLWMQTQQHRISQQPQHSLQVLFQLNFLPLWATIFFHLSFTYHLKCSFIRSEQVFKSAWNLSSLTILLPVSNCTPAIFLLMYSRQSSKIPAEFWEKLEGTKPVFIRLVLFSDMTPPSIISV